MTNSSAAPLVLIVVATAEMERLASPPCACHKRQSTSCDGHSTHLSLSAILVNVFRHVFVHHSPQYHARQSETEANYTNLRRLVVGSNCRCLMMATEVCACLSHVRHMTEVCTRLSHVSCRTSGAIFSDVFSRMLEKAKSTKRTAA